MVFRADATSIVLLPDGRACPRLLDRKAMRHHQPVDSGQAHSVLVVAMSMITGMFGTTTVAACPVPGATSTRVSMTELDKTSSIKAVQVRSFPPN